jgi:hypothetical protein
MLVRYAFLADTVTLDAVGKINAIGIFENVLAQNFPSVHRDMCLVINLEGTINERGEHKITVEFRDSDSNKLASVDQKIALGNPKITHGTLRAGVIMKFQDLLFQRAGQYEFVVFGNDRFLNRVTFMVNQIEIKEAGEK